MRGETRNGRSLQPRTSSHVDASVRKYVESLASDAPTPGGGSAAALVAALGISLLSMAGGISGASKRPRLKLERLRVQALACLDRDADAYAALTQALRTLRADPTPSTYRTFERALQEAVLVPLQVRRQCDEALELLDGMMSVAKPWLASDIRIAGHLLQAAKRGTGELVRANLRMMRTPAMRRLLKEAKPRTRSRSARSS